MLRGEHVMPLVSVVQRSDGLKVMSVSESYYEFKKRMFNEGWTLRIFKCHDQKAVAQALHRWFDPSVMILSPVFYRGHENEFWYRERV